jgi:hypothetical protein
MWLRLQLPRATSSLRRCASPAVCPIHIALLPLTDSPHAPQDAVVALEESLEPMLEALCEKAIAHAETQGRETFTIEDLKAVSGDIIKLKK